MGKCEEATGEGVVVSILIDVTATTAVERRSRDLAALIKIANSCHFFMKLKIRHLDLNLTSEKVNIFYFQT